MENAPVVLFVSTAELFAETQSLDDGTIAIDVAVVQIVKESAALTYQLGQGAGGSEILVVLLQVLSQVRDAIREESNLAFCRTGIGSALAILTKDFLFFCLI